MSEITIEQVKEQVLNYEAAKNTYTDLQEQFNPHRHRVTTVTADFRDAQDVFSVAHARLCLSLDAQLQQEREARERAEEALSWYADTSIYRDEIEGEPVVMVDDGSLARKALARAEQEQADAGEGSA